MAYRYTGGLSIDDLLDISPDQLIDMGEKELREVVSRLGQAANKRIRRGLKTEFPSPAITAARRGGKFSVANRDITGLRNEYVRARSFLSNPLSTQKGYQKVQRDIKDKLEQNGYKVNRKDIPEMIDKYRALTDEDGSVLTRGERYKYLREMGTLAGAETYEEAEKTGQAILNRLADELNDLGMEDDTDEYDDSGVSEFFELL